MALGLVDDLPQPVPVVEPPRARAVSPASLAVFRSAATPTFVPPPLPCFCCRDCEALTVLIGAHRSGRITAAQLDDAVAAHACARSPIRGGAR